ncbi:hypothetical protein OKA06_06060 [Novosphingobium sp. MW5]|nr:hypothetical protein [Novosphingobium sp. MW5]
MAYALMFALGGFAPDAQADTLTINATGTILGSCQISVGSNFPTNADLSVSGSSSASAVVNCSTPFKINATSSNGALTTSAAAVSGFTNSLVYTLAMSVPLNTGGPVTASCTSAQLVSGQSSCALSPGNSTGLYSGATGTATNKTASLTASWTTPTTPRLVAGAYADTLTVSIAAVP